MNCLDYRRTFLATMRETAPMLAHRQSCARCTALREEHLALEAEIERALAVPARPELAESMITGLGPAPVPGRRRMLAAAAAIGTLAVGGAAWWWSEHADPLALACVQWVVREEAKSIMMGAMPRAEAARALAPIVPLERLDRIGNVRHIAPCPFEGATAVHVVLTVGEEKITLLAIADRRPTRFARATQDNLYARVIPAGSGSIGIVASSRGAVEDAARKLMQPRSPS